MKHLLNPLDFSVEELNELLDLARYQIIHKNTATHVMAKS